MRSPWRVTPAGRTPRVLTLRIPRRIFGKRTMIRPWSTWPGFCLMVRDRIILDDNECVVRDLPGDPNAHRRFGYARGSEHAPALNASKLIISFDVGCIIDLDHFHSSEGLHDCET